MEKLRSRPAYSIVAALRSTALRRVAKHVLAHRRAFDRPRPRPLTQKPRKSKASYFALPNQPNGGLDKLFHRIDGYGRRRAGARALQNVLPSRARWATKLPRSRPWLGDGGSRGSLPQTCSQRPIG